MKRDLTAKCLTRTRDPQLAALGGWVLSSALLETEGPRANATAPRDTSCSSGHLVGSPLRLCRNSGAASVHVLAPGKGEAADAGLWLLGSTFSISDVSTEKHGDAHGTSTHSEPGEASSSIHTGHAA